MKKRPHVGFHLAYLQWCIWLHRGCDPELWGQLARTVRVFAGTT